MPKLLISRCAPGGKPAGEPRAVSMPARDYAALLVWQWVRNWLFRVADFADRRIQRRIRRLRLDS